MSNDARLAITMGDPAGVGPEICLRLLAAPPAGTAPVVYGDLGLLQRVAGATGLPGPDPAHVHHLDALGDPAAVRPGEVQTSCGNAAYTYLTAAIDHALDGAVDAIVTAPVNKAALHAAGIDFPGHTEILAHHTGVTDFCMMQVSEPVTATFVTCHCGYADVPSLLTGERINTVIDLTVAALTKMQDHPPKLVALGLNPHAGEGGLFGDREEERTIAPALEQARARGVDITGPVPPDTAFIPAVRETTDAYICMTHDQGHIPLKALAFDSAVNTTLGLPLTRTSVDHGTAFDIAWQGTADPSSLFAATSLATRLCKAPR